MSWIVIEKSTSKVICEFFDKRSIDKLNTEKYIAVDSYEYLCQINKDLNP